MCSRHFRSTKESPEAALPGRLVLDPYDNQIWSQRAEPPSGLRHCVVPSAAVPYAQFCTLSRAAHAFTVMSNQK
jgi:hypothetical protein